MSNYKHGIYTEESSTTTPSLQTITSGITVSVGLSPIHLAANPVGINRPTLCYDKSTYVNYFGDTDDIKTYTNAETAEVMFDIFNVSPVVFVNVFNPRVHKTDVTKEITLANGVATLAAPILLDTLVVKGKQTTIVEIQNGDNPVDDDIDDDLDGTTTYTTAIPISGGGADVVDDDDDGGTTPTVTTETRITEVLLVKGDDYTTETDGDNNIIVTITSLGKITDSKATFSYSQPDPSKVTIDDIIGKVDPTTGKCTGIKLISEVYARTGILPGSVIAPGWSKYPKVAAALAAAVELINGHFKAGAPVDLDTTEIGGYGEAGEWKTQNGFTSKFQFACYPMVGLSGTLYHLSTYVAALLNRLDGQNDEIPYNSPSNKAISIDGMYNEDGSENYFGLDAANDLNGNGIITCINFNGWKLWGNRTAVYPQSNDPKDNFVAIRRMFNFVNNNLVINYWSQIDEPTNRRLIDSVINSANTWLNGLTSRGALLGGRVEFLDSDNGTMNLMDGKLRFRVYFTPPSPAREITFIQEYDPDYLSTLFE